MKDSRKQKYLKRQTKDSYLALSLGTALHHNSNKKSGRFTIHLTLLGLLTLFPLPSWSMDTESGFFSQKQKVRILTIDGGNLQGVIPITILEKMEEVLQSKCGQEACLAPCFDLMTGTSTSGIIALGLSCLDQESKKHPNKAGKLSRFYSKNGDNLFSSIYLSSENAFEELFGNTWLSESLSHVLVAAYNIGQQCAYLFDSQRAKELKSEDFKMQDIARASLAELNHPITIENRKGEKSAFARGDIYSFDPTLEAIKKADRMFPRCNLQIVSLGTGEFARQFGTTATTITTTAALDYAMSNHRDSPSNHLNYLQEKISQGIQQVDYYRIQPILGHSVINMDALRQIGLYVSNPLGSEFTIFEKVVIKLEEAYKEYSEQGTPQKNILKGLESRPWQQVTKSMLIHWLPNRPIEFIESVPEGSDKSYLTLLWEELHHASAAVPTVPGKALVVGMGGIGKTYLALQYAYEALDHHAYNLIYWLSSETEYSLMKGYKNLLQDLDVSIKDADDEHVVRLVNQYVSKKGKCLLVYDNAPYPEFLKGKIPQDTNIDALITSRCCQGWEKNPISLDVLRPEDSIKYLVDMTGVEPNEDNKSKAMVIAQELGHLPLALSHAASYIKYINNASTSGDIFERYSQELRSKPDIHFISHKDPFTEQPEINYEHLIAKIWSMSGDIISSLAKELIVCFAYLGPDLIPKAVFLEYAKKEETLIEAFAQLSNFSLIKSSQEYASIHRLVQLIIRSEQERKENLSRLPNRMSNLLTSLFNYWQKVDQELNNKGTNLSQIEKFYQIVCVLPTHLDKLYKHLKRLDQAHKEIEKDRSFLNLKIGTLSLKCLLENSLTSLRRQILEKTFQIPDFNKQEFISRENLLKDEAEKVGLKLKPGELKIIDPLLSSDTDEIYNVMKVFSEVNSTYLQAVVAIAKKFMDPSLSASSLVELIKAINKLNPEQLQMIEGANVDKFITSSMSVEERIKFIQALSSIDSTQLNVTGVDNVDKFIPSNIGTDDWAAIIQSPSKVDSEKLQMVTMVAKKFITPEMSRWHRVKIIEVLDSIDLAQLQAFAAQVEEFINPDMDTWDRTVVIQAFSKANPDQLRTLAETAKEFITSDMKGDDRTRVIQALSEINPNQLQALAETAKEFITSEMKGDDQAKVMQALSKVNPNQLQALAKTAKEFITSDMKGDDRARVIQALSKVTPDQLQALAETVKEFITFDMKGDNRSRVIQAISKVNPNQLQALAGKAKELITPEMVGGWAWATVIEALAEVAPDQREAIVKSAQSLIIPEMSGENRAIVIYMLAEVAPDQREAVVKSAQSLIMPEMNGEDLVVIIKTLAEVAPDQLEMVAEYMHSLVELSQGNNQDNQILELKNIVTPTIQKIGLHEFIKLVNKAFSPYEVFPSDQPELRPKQRVYQWTNSSASTTSRMAKEPKYSKQGEAKKVENISTTSDQNMLNTIPEVDSLQLSQFESLQIPLRNDIEGLLIRNKPINIDGKPQEVYIIDGKSFRRQNVLGVSMRCFFNAVGLEPEVEIAKLDSKHDDPIVRYMIANETVSAAANPEQLPKSVKDAINYELYRFQRGELDKLEEKRSNILTIQNSDGNQQNPKALPQVFQETGVQGENILEDLRKRSLSLKTFRAFLKYHIGSEQMMVALHDVQGSSSGNVNSNYTSIDAVAYVNNLGLKIYQPNGVSTLHLVHQFIPQGATEIVYLYHQGYHFQALVLE